MAEVLPNKGSDRNPLFVIGRGEDAAHGRITSVALSVQSVVDLFDD